MRRTVAVAFSAVFASLVLSSCSTPVKAGSAAIVGDDQVSTESVESTSQRVRVQAGEADLGELDGAAVNRITVERSIRSLLTAELAARAGVTVSDGEVDDYLAQIEDRGQGEQLELDALNAGVPRDELRDEIRDFLLRSKVARTLVSGSGPAVEQQRVTVFNDAMQKLAEETYVSVNPRYGAWDAATVSVVPLEDDLSRLPSGAS